MTLPSLKHWALEGVGITRGIFMKYYQQHNLSHSLIKKQRRNNTSKKKRTKQKKNFVQCLLLLLEYITKIANLIDKLLDLFWNFF